MCRDILSRFIIHIRIYFIMFFSSASPEMSKFTFSYSETAIHIYCVHYGLETLHWKSVELVELLKRGNHSLNTNSTLYLLSF